MLVVFFIKKLCIFFKCRVVNLFLVFVYCRCMIVNIYGYINKDK